MSRRALVIPIATSLALALLAGGSTSWTSTGASASEHPHGDDSQVGGLAWLSDGSATFSVDANEGTVRFRSCDVDTGRIDDPDMDVQRGVASGEFTVDGTTYRYRVPLRGRTEGVVKVSDSSTLRAEVVTNPLPLTNADKAELLEPLTERLRSIVDDSTQNPAGVVVRDLSGRYGDAQVGVNSAFRPKAASVIKLWILVELLRRIDCGQASFTDGVVVLPSDVVDGTGELQHETFPQTVTLYRLAEYMIKYSDNTAANVLINYLGGFAPVNALIDTLNERETILARKMLDTEAAMRGEENYTSPRDVISLLGAVWDGDILSQPSRDLMLHFMLEQTLNTKIPAALPPGVPVAHKTGDLPDASHDVGYYLIPGTEIAVAFLTGGPIATGDEVVRQLARAVYDYLQIPTT